MKATTLLQKMETRFPEKKFNVSEFQDSNYKIAHIEIDSKMAFEQIIDGLGWKEEKITEATEKLVLQYEETFNKINEELKKGTYVKKEILAVCIAMHNIEYIF